MDLVTAIKVETIAKPKTATITRTTKSTNKAFSIGDSMANKTFKMVLSSRTGKGIELRTDL
jgi:hypothetical protein